jgi:hypothetical protein
MKIIKILNQNRRDFTAIIKCEGCGNEEKLKYGYDDKNYHDNVIPNMKCSNCKKSRNDLGIITEKTKTKYAEWEII